MRRDLASRAILIAAGVGTALGAGAGLANAAPLEQDLQQDSAGRNAFDQSAEPTGALPAAPDLSLTDGLTSSTAGSPLDAVSADQLAGMADVGGLLGGGSGGGPGGGAGQTAPTETTDGATGSTENVSPSTSTDSTSPSSTSPSSAAPSAGGSSASPSTSGSTGSSAAPTTGGVERGGTTYYGGA